MQHARESATESDPIIGPIRFAAFERHPALRRVRDYLDQDIARPLTLSIAAEVAGLNAKYFSALFHTRIRVRFIDWLHFMRTERAKQILEDTCYPIAEVAVRVGYNDLRTFERAFKKCNACTAQRFRQQMAQARRPRPSGAPQPPAAAE